MLQATLSMRKHIFTTVALELSYEKEVQMERLFVDLKQNMARMAMQSIRS
jgi:hypothetical protein